MDFGSEEEEGMWMGRSGWAKRAVTWEARAARGVRARFFVGRCERGSAEVGMDSGIGSDMAAVVVVVVVVVMMAQSRSVCEAGACYQWCGCGGIVVTGLSMGKKLMVSVQYQTRDG